MSIFEVFEGYDDTILLERAKRLLEIKSCRVDFATNYHLNTNGERLSFRTAPHVRELYNSISPEIVLQGSVQSFKSEWAIVDHLAAAYMGMSIFFVLPKFESRNAYVQTRVDKRVQEVTKYREIMGAGFFDNVVIKSFGRGVIKYVGSNVISDFREFPADMIYVEEVDECNGSNIELASDRLRASKYQFKRFLGNPGHEGAGINALYKDSDQRSWTVPCKNCGKLSEMDWFKTIVKEVRDSDDNIISCILRDKDWSIGCGRDIHIICPNCSGVLERLSEKGKWEAKKPTHKRAGYHFSMMCSPVNPISDMWQRFQKALHDPSKLTKFYNSELGLPFSSSGNRLTMETLNKCVDRTFYLVCKENEAYVEDNVSSGPCQMGVDVGGNLDVVITKWEGMRRRLLYVGKVKTTGEIHNLITRYNVEKCVMDSGPESLMAKDFQLEASCDVWLCHYHPQEGTDKRVRYDGSIRVISIDRTFALDKSFAAFKSRQYILPLNYEAIVSGEYKEEMVMPVRQLTEDARGNKKWEWTKGKDHQRHADTYNMLAGEMLRESVISDIYIG